MDSCYTLGKKNKYKLWQEPLSISVVIQLYVLENSLACQSFSNEFVFMGRVSTKGLFSGSSVLIYNVTFIWKISQIDFLAWVG